MWNDWEREDKYKASGVVDLSEGFKGKGIEAYEKGPTSFSEDVDVDGVGLIHNAEWQKNRKGPKKSRAVKGIRKGS